MHADFRRAADAIRQVARAMGQLVLPAGPPWPPGSRVAQEVTEDAAYSGRWGTRPVQDATMGAVGALVMAEEHLLGMARLVETPGIVLAPITLSRPVLAAAARAFYQLDPAVEVRERLRRSMNIQLASYAERSGLLDDSDPWQRIRLTTLTLAITQTAPQYGFAVGTGGKRPAQLWPERWLDERLPREMQLVEQLLKGEQEGAGTLAYRYASALTHAQPHGLGMANIDLLGPLVDGVGEGHLAIAVGRLANYLAPAVYGVHLACARACEHIGVPVVTWDRAVRPALTTLGRLMTD